METKTPTLKSYITDVPDFPKKGIIFKDLTSLLESPEGVEQCLEALISTLKNKQIDKIVGIEARGFFFGMLMATALKVPFVPVRKPGKLPRKVISQSYELEYGSDVLEMHEDAIKSGEKIVIHDDVLATGGTLLAGTELITKTGAKLTNCAVFIEISALNGRNRLGSIPVHSSIIV